MEDVFIGLASNGERQVLKLSRANRHGLVAGATGTGKTVTLQTLAEQFSAAGVPVFLADVKGDLSGICMPGSHDFKHAATLEATWQSHVLETEKLKNSLRDLNDKIQEAKRKKNLLLARQRRAQAQAKIQETMSSMSEKSAFEAFARMEEKIDQNERMLKASTEIDEEFSGDRLAGDFKRLEKQVGSASADQQLLALKQKMGLLPAGKPATPKQIGGGAETVDAQIDEKK